MLAPASRTRKATCCRSAGRGFLIRRNARLLAANPAKACRSVWSKENACRPRRGMPMELTRSLRWDHGQLIIRTILRRLLPLALPYHQLFLVLRAKMESYAANRKRTCGGAKADVARETPRRSVTPNTQSSPANAARVGGWYRAS